MVSSINCWGFFTEESPTNQRLAQVDGRVNVQQLPTLSQRAAPEHNADGDQQQAQDENSGQDQEDQDADVRMWRAGKEKIINPESDQCDAAAGGQHRTG